MAARVAAMAEEDALEAYNLPANALPSSSQGDFAELTAVQIALTNRRLRITRRGRGRLNHSGR